MQQKSIFTRLVDTTVALSNINTIIYHHREDEIYFDETYQRDYVWSTIEQQQLLQAIFTQSPIDSIAVVINERESTKYFEIVDGRQRITTILKFVDNEIPFIVNDKEIFFKDLSAIDKKMFGSTRLPSVNLVSFEKNGVVSYKDKINYFYKKNFSGVPQSTDHKNKIEKMIHDL